MTSKSYHPFGMEIDRKLNSRPVFLQQSRYACKAVERYGVESAKGLYLSYGR